MWTKSVTGELQMVKCSNFSVTFIQSQQQFRSHRLTGNDQYEDLVVPGYVQLRWTEGFWILARLHGRRQLLGKTLVIHCRYTATLKKSMTWVQLACQLSMSCILFDVILFYFLTKGRQHLSGLPLCSVFREFNTTFIAYMYCGVQVFSEQTNIRRDEMREF